jgi:Predicted membrane protein|tara:strand:- start:99 stop:491 length:393 start_codon:yes stop_codon:yes gene_type:complete
MTALLELTVYFTVWTLITVVVGAAIRNQEWTREGRDIGLGNRDNLKEATPMGGRAERAAKNSIEAAVFFVPLALIANAAGLDAEVMLGAQVAFWARIAYVPIYIAGIKYLRSLVWIGGAVGYGMMVAAML